MEPSTAISGRGLFKVQSFRKPLRNRRSKRNQEKETKHHEKMLLILGCLGDYEIADERKW
jgi:hypothetical protein